MFEYLAMLETPLATFNACPPAISAFIAPKNGLLALAAEDALLVEKIPPDVIDGRNAEIAKPDIFSPSLL